MELELDELAVLHYAELRVNEAAEADLQLKEVAAELGHGHRQQWWQSLGMMMRHRWRWSSGVTILWQW
ncbi:hypothetical protein E2562_027967 [Oryza meyeriana var. granulata]|uniref:Uncharacterized protein n=1 Tax=Oryza meyeriana var. granulata TaxID=110450 RepID=A0A6G1CTS6_9ORYZ|nr:hypothetical protein E2562_027967 [Oryza meyeriana var. granulata]